MRKRFRAFARYINGVDGPTLDANKFHLRRSFRRVETASGLLVIETHSMRSGQIKNSANHRQ